MVDETKAARGALRKYLIEFLAAMTAYMLVLMASVSYVASHADSPWRVPVGLLPLLPVALLVWALVRHYGRVDEMARRGIVESIALAFVISAPIVITLGFLESAGVPVSIWWAWVAMGGAWALASLLVQVRYR